MLVTLQEIIGMAEKGNYCIPAFNVYNTETVMGVFDAAEEAKAPVIMQVYPRLFNEYVGYYLAPWRRLKRQPCRFASTLITGRANRRL